MHFVTFFERGRGEVHVGVPRGGFFKENVLCFFTQVYELCLVHVIWTERQMSKLVLNVKYLLLLSFLTVAKFYNLGHIQGIIRVH